jgi:hypothetical protein
MSRVTSNRLLALLVLAATGLSAGTTTPPAAAFYVMANTSARSPAKGWTKIGKGLGVDSRLRNPAALAAEQHATTT